MSLDELAQLATSAAAVAALMSLCWAIGFRGGAAIAGEDQVRALAAAEAPGTAIVGVAIDAGGAAALAGLADGRVLVVRAMGDQCAARVLARDGVAISLTRPGRLCVRTTDIGFPALTLRLSGPGLPDWLAQRTSRPI